MRELLRRIKGGRLGPKPFIRPRHYSLAIVNLVKEEKNCHNCGRGRGRACVRGGVEGFELARAILGTGIGYGLRLLANALVNELKRQRSGNNVYSTLHLSTWLNVFWHLTMPHSQCHQWNVELGPEIRRMKKHRSQADGELSCYCSCLL